MGRIVTAGAVFVSLLVVLSPGTASATSSVGSISVDPRTGIATWTDVIDCTPEDDVEIDISITQRNAEAFTAADFECPTSGTMVVNRDTLIEEGSSRLRPGPAHVSIQRVDFLAASDFQDSRRSSASADVRLDPSPH